MDGVGGGAAPLSPPDDASLRAELEEAISKIRQQIEVQLMSDHYIGSGQITADAVGELQTELTQLKQALADLNKRGS